MSEFFDEPDESQDEKEPFEADPSTIAFLDQQQAEFGNITDEFFDTYGFKHDCHCGEDYAAGRVGEITQCYHNMLQEAMVTCARLNIELKEMTAIAQALYAELKQHFESELDKEAKETSNDESDVRVSDAEVQPSSSEELDGDGSERAARDAAGEGFGSASYDVGAADEEGSPLD